MNRKIILLVLAVVSAVILTLPSMAMAIQQLHLNPAPEGAQFIDSNGAVRLSTTNSTATILCNGFAGTASFESGGTTGTINLTFGNGCAISGIGGVSGPCTSAGELSGNIATTALPFHLATVRNNSVGTGPGVLVTPGANEHFATFTCTVFGIPVEYVIKGNGLVGTFTSPECGNASTQATIEFGSDNPGVQSHKTLVGTGTTYRLTRLSEQAALEMHGTLTFREGGQLLLSELICT